MRARLPPSALALAALALAAAALRALLRDFPLDDDWAYYTAARALVERGELRVPDIVSPTMIAHTAWGALFAKAFGLSFGALRASTLALSALALALFSRLSVPPGREAGPATGLHLLANPLFFLLSFTYMTDVPYLAWFLLSVLLYRAALREDRASLWLAASAAAGLAYLVRQIGVLIPAGVVLLLWRSGTLTPRRAALALGPALLAVGLHQAWFHFAHGPTWASVVYNGAATAALLSDPLRLSWEVYRRLAGGVLCLGLFTAPLALGALRGWRRPGAGAAAAALVFLAPFLLLQGAFPYFLNIIHEAGLGSPTIPGLEAKISGLLGRAEFRAGLTAAALGSLTVWLGRARDLRAALAAPEMRLWALCSALQLAPPLAGGLFFDRYLLPALPFTLALGLRVAAPGRAGAGALALMLAWSVFGTWDYLNWSQARWDASREAARLGVEPERLMGGIEWNGLHSYEKGMATARASKPLAEIGEWEWLPPGPMRAVVAFCAPEGGEPLVARGYWTPLSARRGAVCVEAIRPRPPGP
ncbi:MAG: glycosyltransferase family 39 protein [Elusimicrobiota bacterium]|nr:glycosyltransferase family 39 protein [Elusimicrobiota bacterium]